MHKFKKIIISLLCFIMPGCSNNIIQNSNQKPHLNLKKFFNGNLDGWGIVFDYRGRQVKSFHVNMKGSWQGNQGLLKEWFEFDDGVKTTRDWRINFSDEQNFTAQAGDVVGSAVGIQQGNTVNVKYILKIPYGKRELEVKMDDWMYLVKEGVVLNRTSMKKFGFKVGELFICMKKK